MYTRMCMQHTYMHTYIQKEQERFGGRDKGICRDRNRQVHTDAERERGVGREIERDRYTDMYT